MQIQPADLNALTCPDAALDEWIIAKRRALHRCPELSGQEVRTRAFLLAELEALGVERVDCDAGCAVVGMIRGGLPGPTVALRADMDALPVEEPEGLPFRSERPGVMHACGHDAHMAILLGAARILTANRERMRGNVKLLFEPAEETTGGAQAMIAAGCLENPKVDAVFGLHMSPDRPAGHFSTRIGANSGSSDELELIVRGTASHGAYPERGVDAIVIAAQVVLALQALVSRETSPLDSAVISLGVIEGGTACNIICDRVRIHGTLRTLLPETRARLKQRIVEVTAGVAQSMGGQGEAKITPGYGAVINDPQLTAGAFALARAVLGEDRVYTYDHPSLGVESFSFFVQSVPGIFWNMSCGVGAPIHAREFFIDESCLPTAARMQAALAWESQLALCP